MARAAEVRIRKENLPWKGRLRAVEEGSCRGILPASLVEKGGRLTAFYQTGGYRRLSLLSDIGYEDMKDILRSTAKNILVCEDGCFFADEYVLNCETVFLSERGRDTKFIYIPERKVSSRSKALMGLIFQMKRLADNSGLHLIERVSAHFVGREWDAAELIHYLDQLPDCEVNQWR